MSVLYFIRHGLASFGKENYDELSETGVKQAELLAEYFLSAGIRFDEVYSGTMKRHLGTADEYLSAHAAAGKNPPALKKLPGLDEYDSKAILTRLIPVLIDERPEYIEYTNNLLGDKKSFQIVFESVMAMWASGDYDMGEIQTWKQFSKGVGDAVGEIMRECGSGKSIGVFTSGGPVSAVMQSVLGLSDEMTMRLREQIVNSSFTRFKFSAQRIMISSFNEYPHLELSGNRGMITYR